TVFGKNQDAGLRRPLADVVEVVLGDGDSTPKPLAQDGDVKFSLRENLLKIPCGVVIASGVAKAVRIVADDGDAKSFERRLVFFRVAAVAREECDAVSHAAKFSKQFKKS